jgi:tetratricopeptide (TPR) repeat protein
LSKPASTKLCIACHESIHGKATICRHCGTEQQPKPWRSVAQVLKWIGGITAVISLVLGTLQINDLFSDWQERKTAVSQLIDAAALQTDSSDYKGAWQLIDEALSLNPSSLSARQQQMTIAMAWLRNIRVQGNETFSDIVDKLLPTLYLGSVNENFNTAANAFTHIGWANYLRMSEGVGGLEIEEYFRRALNIDPDNSYAHVMWGYWILSPRNQNSISDADVEIAKAHFSSALENEQDREFVRGLQLSALQQATYGPIVQIELIKVAHEIKQQQGTLSQRNRTGVFLAMQDIIAPSNSIDQNTQVAIKQLTEQLSPAIILELFEWLDYNKDTLSGILINARMHELNGNLERALSYYQTLINTPSASPSNKEFAQQAVNRLSGTTVRE